MERVEAPQRQRHRQQQFFRLRQRLKRKRRGGDSGGGGGGSGGDPTFDAVRMLGNGGNAFQTEKHLLEMYYQGLDSEEFQELRELLQEGSRERIKD